MICFQGSVGINLTYFKFDIKEGMYEGTGMRYRGQTDDKEKQEQRKGKERKRR